MHKKIRNTVCLLGCLFWTVLFLCGCEKKSALVITDAEGNVIEQTQVKDEAKADSQGEAFETETEESLQTIFVHVTGEVQHPGVYELPVGARVFEAVQKAGGMTEQAVPDSVNQAALLSDGEMIVLYSASELMETQAGQGMANTAKKADERIDINTADVDRLCSISGIGETRAERIVAYRKEHGPFQSIEEIKNVSGIKDGLFEKIKDKIRV